MNQAEDYLKHEIARIDEAIKENEAIAASPDADEELKKMAKEEIEALKKTKRRSG